MGCRTDSEAYEPHYRMHARNGATTCAANASCRELAPRNTEASHTGNRRECFHLGTRSWRGLIPIDRHHGDRRLSRQSQKPLACVDRSSPPVTPANATVIRRGKTQIPV